MEWPLFAAAAWGRAGAVAALAALGGDVDRRRLAPGGKAAKVAARSPAWAAARGGRLGALVALAEAGADLVGALEVLVEAGADLDAGPPDGRGGSLSPLLAVRKRSSTACCSSSAGVKGLGDGAFLREALRAGDSDAAVALVKAGEDPELADPETGEWPLYVAAAKNLVRVLEALRAGGRADMARLMRKKIKNAIRAGLCGNQIFNTTSISLVDLHTGAGDLELHVLDDATVAEPPPRKATAPEPPPGAAHRPAAPRGGVAVPSLPNVFSAAGLLLLLAFGAAVAAATPGRPPRDRCVAALLRDEAPAAPRRHRGVKVRARADRERRSPKAASPKAAPLPPARRRRRGPTPPPAERPPAAPAGAAPAPPPPLELPRAALPRTASLLADPPGRARRCRAAGPSSARSRPSAPRTARPPRGARPDADRRAAADAEADRRWAARGAAPRRARAEAAAARRAPRPRPRSARPRRAAAAEAARAEREAAERREARRRRAREDAKRARGGRARGAGPRGAGGAPGAQRGDAGAQDLASQVREDRAPSRPRSAKAAASATPGAADARGGRGRGRAPRGRGARELDLSDLRRRELLGRRGLRSLPLPGERRGGLQMSALAKMLSSGATASSTASPDYHRRSPGPPSP
ncbi:hypothetical protein JL720_40 [Aureococcus anophagefferens]|nr:hypothetical protein JL720_40 [Aureococcus anophagefferens]